MHKTIDGNKQTYEADMDKHWSTGWRTPAGEGPLLQISPVCLSCYHSPRDIVEPILNVHRSDDVFDRLLSVAQP